MSTAFAPETDVAQEPAAEAQTAAETVDWEAEAKATKAELAKLQNDLRANAGRKTKEDALMTRIAAMEAKIDAVSEHLTSGDKADPVLKTKVEQAARAATETAETNEDYEVLWEQLNNAVKGTDGKPIIDLRTAPELAELREAWNVEYKKITDRKRPSYGRLSRLVAEAVEAKNQALLKDKDTALATEREARKNTRKEVIKDLGLDEMDIGAGSGSGGEKRSFTRADLAAMTPEQYRKARPHIIGK